MEATGILLDITFFLLHLKGTNFNYDVRANFILGTAKFGPLNMYQGLVYFERYQFSVKEQKLIKI